MKNIFQNTISTLVCFLSKNNHKSVISIGFFLASTLSVFGQKSDTWSATDALGRKTPTIMEVGGKNSKIVGMFYWTWRQDGLANNQLMNTTQIITQYPAAATEIDHPAWNGIINGGSFWWDEPLFGYYRSGDDWVLRKHAEMLADAGVDVVFFDNTNGTYTWKESYMKLLQVWNQAILDGVKAPQIAFMLPFGTGPDTRTQLTELYYDLYKPGLFSNLWFKWNAKPLIMAYPESITPFSNAAGMKFTAASPFTAINASCPSWGNNIGNLTFKLYQWNTNYATSVAGTVVAQSTFTNFADNQKLQLSFAALPAGDYVWELSNGTETVGVWKWTDGSGPSISYFGGSQITGNYESEITYSQDNFTPLSSGTNHIPVQITQSLTQSQVDEIKAFFTFRPGQPDYVNGPSRNDQWGWLELAPQHGYGPKTGGFEMATAGVAQNACPATNGHASAFNRDGTYGRSYTKASGQNTSPDALFQGLNFQEQWNGASALNPDMIFVTGWNEWIAGRWTNWGVPFAFVDSYSHEKSRDIEPVKAWGDKGDVYYMQLVNNIRKFKGVEVPDFISAPKTIAIGSVNDWANVEPEFGSYKGNTLSRNYAGQGAGLTYTNTTGRNDIVKAKVARDAGNVYFYVETAVALTSKTDAKWMRLFIDIDRNKATGWQGYDYVINRSSPGTTATVEKSTNGWSWSSVGTAQYAINSNKLELKIANSVMGVTSSETLNFEFKWSDNMQVDGDIMDFYVNGDVAPGGRFNYVYDVNSQAVSSTNANSVLAADKAVDGINNNFWSSKGNTVATATEWIYVDQRSSKPVGQVVLYPRYSGTTALAFPSEFKIQYSNDAITWTDVPGQSYSNYAVSGSASGEVFSFSGLINTRFIRIYATKLNKDDSNITYYFQLAEIKLVGTTLSVPIFKVKNFNFYPNPSSGKFTIYSEQNVQNIKIHDMRGSEVYSNSEKFNGTKTFDLYLTKGVYLLNLSGDVPFETQKLIIE